MNSKMVRALDCRTASDSAFCAKFFKTATADLPPADNFPTAWLIIRLRSCATRSQNVG